MLNEIRILLGTARDILAAEAIIVSRLNGSEWHEQLFQMDNQVWAILNRVLEIISELEKEPPNGNGAEPEK